MAAPPTKPAAPVPAPAATPAAAPAKKRMVRWPFLVAGAGVVGLAAWKFADLKQGATVIMDAVSQTLTTAMLATVAPNAIQYLDVIDSVAARYNISPFVLVALGQRETRWGDASKPKGPAGTGDFAGRHYGATTVANLGSLIKQVSVLPAGWSAGGLAAPWYIPSDELGWGRGLLQIDLAAHYPWLASNNWRDPAANIAYGAQVFTSYASQLAANPGLSGNDLLKATLAAYNTGVGNVRTSLKSGLDPDATTTGHDYGSATLNTILTLQAMLA